MSARATKGKGAPMEEVVHTIGPLYDAHSRVLLLGSVPSPLSRKVSCYYGNTQNRFWRVLYALWGLDLSACEPDGLDVAARRAFCLEHGIALWDVIARCRIRGASDASITDVVPNDLRLILDAADVREIFATGSAAGRYYRRLIEPELGRPVTVLPSTSPANAAWSFERLVEAYVPVRDAAAPTEGLGA